MVVKFPQLSRPLTAFALVRAADLKIIQRLLQPQVWIAEEIPSLAGWTLITSCLHTLNTLLTEALPTAGGLVGLSEN